MPTPVIATKLLIPPLRPQVLLRSRLIARLAAGLQRKLTLISAPAGFGKTTLASTWLADCGRPVAWLSLDSEESDPARFLTYLVAALQRVAPGVGTGVLRLLQSPQPPPVEALLPTLLNELAALPHAAVLVLDDYHTLDSRPVNQALTALVEHLPPQLHLVMLTREDPPLPLARLRVRSQLTELRAADLRFTASEAADFLREVMGLSLAEDNIAALEARTEGWIAGLQLAALSLQGRDDAGSAIAAFSGSHRFVLDYLLEEVLHRQPAPIQQFLLRTAILDRLCGPLCDAVMGDATLSGQATLDACERANLFLVPLDQERRWYRYHHLFADLLRQRLQQRPTAVGAEGPEIVDLHRRASAWYEDNGHQIEAFQHAATAGDVDGAARLIAGKGMPLHFRGLIHPVLRWLEGLPTTALNTRPALWVTYASAAAMLGQPADTVEAKLQAAEVALRSAVADDTTRDIHGQIAAIRAMLAIPLGHTETIIAQSRSALELLSPQNLSLRTTTSWTLGLAYQLRSERAAAVRAFTDAIASSRASNNTMITIAATTCMGQLQEADNQLDLALATYRRVLAAVGDPPLPFACEAYLGLARLAYAWNDLDAAEQYGQQSLGLAQQLASVDTPAGCLVVLAYVRLARGDLAGAAEILAQAEQFVRQQQMMHRMPDVAAAQVRMLLRQGSLGVAAQLAQTYDLPVGQARVRLARGEPSAALALLEPVHRQAEAKGWQDERLRVLVLQAIAHAAQGTTDQALQHLDAALTLAAPGRLVRLFIDEGQPMAHLLTRMQGEGGRMKEYRSTLLAAFEAPQELHPSSFTPHPLIEPLSPREHEILRLIALGLSNQEIGARLALAESTVKGYNRNLFGKLQVQRRTEAVARARELGLV
ncbi:LuxR family transcriptional regulator [Chloroflexales bacterium ZM16-3]|nr:LuxR family transcriptional regulator [Chloroflexales bacterium ZM16-3]